MWVHHDIHLGSSCMNEDMSLWVIICVSYDFLGIIYVTSILNVSRIFSMGVKTDTGYINHTIQKITYKLRLEYKVILSLKFQSYT